MTALLPDIIYTFDDPLASISKSALYHEHCLVCAEEAEFPPLTSPFVATAPAPASPAAIIHGITK